MAEGAQVTVAPDVQRARHRSVSTVLRANTPRGSFRRRRAAIGGFARTSPGRLSLLTVGLVALIVLAGVVLSSAVSHRTTELSTLIGRTEPLAGASQDLYSALSEADASAASAFLAGGLEPPALRERYTRSIDTAARALGTAAAGAGTDSSGRTALAKLSAELPVYTGLVENARANNQQGFPVGAAYLREASALMQSTLLPSAEQLYQDNSAANAEQSRVRLPWLGMALALISILALGVAQWYVRRHTRRTLNIGLLLATVAIVVALVWAATSSIIGATRIDDGRSGGSEPLARLAQARIVAQQARAEETLMLVARSDSAGYEKSFAGTTGKLTELLESLPQRSPSSAADSARSAARGWLAAHHRLSAANDSGDYPGAVAVALGTGADDSGTQFVALDNALQSGIFNTRQILREKASGARSVFAGLAPGVLVLSLFAAAAVGAGMSPRLREYQ